MRGRSAPRRTRLALNLPGWIEDAACTQRPDLDWFDDGCGVQEAAKVCYSCPAKARCLDYAIELRVEDGIWGGLWGEQLARYIARAGRV